MRKASQALGEASATMDRIDDEPSYAATAYLSGEERSLIRRFLDRRQSLVAHARERLAAALAQRVRPRLPLELQRLDDESLLERL